MVNKIVITTFLTFSCLNCFESLEQAEIYANSVKLPLHQFEASAIPDYTSFYAQHTPSIWQRFLQGAKLSNPIWSIEKFSKILHNLVQKQEHKGYTGNLILTFTPTQGTKIIIFGPLFGTFHSLVRDLIELKRLGFIDDNLNILDPKTFIVFNGNVINGSPFVLETLTLVLSLLDKNPDNVFYIRGEYEDKLYWENTLLKKQLKQQASYLSSEPIPYGRLLARLFNTLPFGLFLNSADPKEGALRISYFRVYGENSFIASSCTKEIMEINDKVRLCKLEPDENTEPVILPISVLVKAEDRLIKYGNQPGLSLLEPERGVPTWAVFSAPNKIYRDLFSFYYDAFAIVTFGSKLFNSTITLYHQDIRELIKFKKVATYNLISGQPIKILASTEPPFPIIFGQEAPPTKVKYIEPKPITGIIRLGSSLDFTKSIKWISEDIRSGMGAAINHINETGGINGKLFQVITLNDNYDPSISRSNLTRFINSGIKFMLMPSGTPTLEASLDLIKKNKLFVLFTNSGSINLRQPNLKNIVNFRPSYNTEAKVLLNYMLSKYHSKKFAFFYQDDSYGIPPLNTSIEPFLYDRYLKAALIYNLDTETQC